jgi:penicillin amidase
MVDGRVAVAGIDQEVEVLRDENGVPHIYADTEHDLFFAQGYVHAQDRFWQMDFWRHIGQGRLSEMFGESQVETDVFLRTLGFAELAEREFAAAPARDQAALRSYADGVNAYLAERSGSALSLEYAVLTLQTQGYTPEPWEPIDTLTWARMMAWELRSNMEQEIWRAIWAGEVGVERAERLFPDFPEDKLTILGGAAGETGAQAPSSALMQAIRPALDELVAKDDALGDLIGPLGPGIGSNNWVVSGAHTATGLPLLADDPHLPIQMPSIWYENGLHCASCGLDLIGFSFAGVPGVIIGHNDRVAWGVTNFGADHMDLFVEKVNPDDEGQYEVNGQWQVFDTRTEVIEVAGGDPV